MFSAVSSKLGRVVNAVFCIAGLVCNILTTIVLRRRNTLGTRLLLYLAYVDVAVLLLFLLLVSMKEIAKTGHRPAVDCFRLFLVPLIRTFYTLEVYLTVLVAVQRCLTLAVPLKFIHFMRDSVFNKALVGMGVLSVLYNLPQWIINPPEFYWSTEYNQTLLKKANTSHIEYSRIYDKSRPIVDSIVPLVMILVCDVIMVISRMRASPVPGQARYTRGKNQLTNIVVSITTVSILLHITVTWLLGIPEFKLPITNAMVKTLRYAAKVLISLNSSINFVFYCLFAPEFRHTLMSLFSRKQGRAVQGQGQGQESLRQITEG